MKKAPLLLSALAVFASAGISQAVTVVYTIVDPALNVLTMTGTAGGTAYLPQGGAGALVDTFSGSITADLTAGVLTFSPGGDSLTAGLNPTAPGGDFLPAGAGLDNYGVSFSPAIGGGAAAFRDVAFDITAGTATNGSATGATFAFSAGKADYLIPAFNGGNQGVLVLPPISTPNASAAPVTLVTVGLTETLTIPISLTYAGDTTTVFTGQLVLQRTIPEPTSLGFLLAGLAGIFRRRR